MARQYSSSKSITSITYWRKFAEHRLIYMALAAVFAVGIVAYFGSMGPGGRSMDNTTRGVETIATVNGIDISRADYDRQWDQAKSFARGNEMQSVQFQGMIVNGMIQSAIMQSAAKARGITVSDSEIDRAIADQKKGPKGKSFSDEEFQQMLQARGMTMDDLREQARQQLMLKGLQASLARQKQITEKDLLDSYNEDHVSHILISTSKLPDAQAKAKADKVYQEAEAGKDFAQLANENTDDQTNKPMRYDPKLKKQVPIGAPKGGDLGWVPATQIATNWAPEFAAQVNKMKPGELSPPVKTKFGYHIIKMIAVRQNLPKDYAKSKAKLLDDYRQQQGGQAMQDFMKKATADAKIAWKDPSFEWRYIYAQNNSGMMGMSGSFMQNQDKLAAKLKEAISKNPSDAEAQYVLGQTLYTRYIMATGPERDKVRAEVIAAYKSALDRMEDSQMRMTLAQLYRESQQPDKALALYQMQQRLLRGEEGPEAKALHMQLQKAFTDLGKPELAAEETKRLKQIADQEAIKKAEDAKRAADAKAAAAKLAATKPGTPPAAAGTTPPAGAGAVTVTNPAQTPPAPKAADTGTQSKPVANAGTPKQ